MAKYWIEGAHRDSGEVAGFVVEAETVEEATAKANERGYVVSATSRIAEGKPDAHANAWRSMIGAPGTVTMEDLATHQQARERAMGGAITNRAGDDGSVHSPGQTAAWVGGWCVFLGLFLAPLAVVGMLCGVAAVEMSQGRRGHPAVGLGLVVTVLNAALYAYLLARWSGMLAELR